MSKKQKTYKVLVINPLILILIPQLIVQYLSRRNLAFSLNKDKIMGLLGIVFVGFWIGSSWLLIKYSGPFYFILLFFIIGSMGLTLIINTYVIGLVFIRKRCYNCRFKDLIIEHELIHLSSNTTEKEVWDSLKKVYTAENMKIYEDSGICDYCPIPAHLIEEQ
ncbi:MAG: hypothetical protein ACUVQ8_01955 [Nitrososphaeria archaeon]